VASLFMRILPEANKKSALENIHIQSRFHKERKRMEFLEGIQKTFASA
jgi:hypothetical protein